MSLTNHKDNPQEEYHFESSSDYCNVDIINIAAQNVRNSINLNEQDDAQLKSIINLEKTRYLFAIGNISHDELKKRIYDIRHNLVKEYHREPFDNGVIDKKFYEELNKLYGYKDE